jgi:formiminotetrahydrofolate cyclodeaminase
VPNQALINCAKHYLRLENFTKDQILEEKLQQASEEASREGGIKEFIEAVASQSPAPGGGSVSACAGSLAAALAGMVSRLTVNKKKYADVKDEISEVMMRADGLKEELFNLISDDAKAFDDVMAAMKMPQDTDKMKAEREKAIQKATIQATRIPLKVMELSYMAIKCSQVVAEKGNVNSLSDAGVSSLAGRTAVIGAYMNVKINIPGIEDEKVKSEIQEKAEKIRKDALEMAQKIENDVISRL